MLCSLLYNHGSKFSIVSFTRGGSFSAVQKDGKAIESYRAYIKVIAWRFITFILMSELHAVSILVLNYIEFRCFH